MNAEVLKLVQKVYGAKNVVEAGKSVLKVYVGTAHRSTVVKDFCTKYKAQPLHGDREGKSAKLKDIEIAFKPGQSAAGGIILKQFKPSQVPGMVNRWITPQDAVARLKQMIQSAHFPSDARADYLAFLNLVTTGHKLSFAVKSMPVDMSSELYEIFLSVKLALLLQANDPAMKKILGLGARPIDRTAVKIYIPAQANFPLVDFFVSYNATATMGTPSIANTKGNCLVSVKAKKGSAPANTVKFHDMFDNPEQVVAYGKTPRGKKQVNQTSVALAEVKAAQMSGAGLLYSIAACGLLGKSPAMVSVAARDYTLLYPTKVPKLAQVLALCAKLAPEGKLSQIVMNHRKTPHFGAGTPTGKLPTGLTAADVSVMSQLITYRFEHGVKTPVAKKDWQFTFSNFSYCVELLLQAMSQRASASKMNFYDMFYDQVLTQRQVAYAVAHIKEGANGGHVTFDYYAAQNFATYLDWVALRSKASINNVSDALGLNL